MKKICYLLMTFFAVASLFAGCNRSKENEPEKPDVKSAGVFAQAQLMDAFTSMYDTWQETTTLPATLKVGEKELTAPQYQYALCKLLSNLKNGSSDNIDVLSYKAADHPERDSYDKETIAVTNGPANAVESGATEDLADIARRMLAAMAEKGQVPNQTIFQRSEAIAFSTNRAVVCMARAIAAYKSDGKLPAEVKTEYLSASATLKGFAQQFVTYLDVWQKTIGTVSADGSHCSDNNSAWQNVHFIPIPYSGGAYADGKDQYAPEFKPYHTIDVAGVQYDAAQCFIIAAKGFLDLVTKEGSAVKQTERNTLVHTLANGKGLSEAIPAADAWASWGSYPWYEKSDDPCAINFSSDIPCNLAIMVRSVSWFLTRAEQLGHIGNFLTYDEDPANFMVEKPYKGNISPMRTLLILARFYKYLLDNKISDKVYDAMKDAKLDYDLYGVVMPDIELQTKEVSTKAEGQTVDALFVAKEAWTATASDAWITVDPASGAAGSPVTIKITTAANTGAAREGTVSIKGGNVVEPLVIKVTQEAYVAPTGATLKDFATEFVKALDVWNANVGTVDACGIHCTDNGNAWESAHFIPIGEPAGNPYGTDGNQYDPKYTVWKLNIKGVEYTSAQAWEIAIRGLLNMTTSEGEAGLPQMDDRNKPFTFADKAGMDAPMPSASADCKWGALPWYEGDNNGGHLVTYNGADIKEVGLDFIIKCGAWHVVRGLIKTPGNQNPLGKIGNYQEFGTSSSTLILEGYEGQISPMRELLILARIYKSLLDNNVENKVFTYLKDKKFDFDLYNQGAPAAANTIKAFAQQYVTILDVWQKTTGTINMITGTNVPTEGENVQFNVENAHYVPDNTKITVDGKDYVTSEMLELAERSYLLLRGMDGNDTNAAGAGKFPKVSGFSMSSDLPASHGYKWGASPYNETAGNGGHLVMGTDASGTHCKVKLDILDNFAERHLNWPLTHNSLISNMCGYVNRLDGYYGCFCAQRALITYAFFFKYMLDNNLQDAKSISADQVFRSELFGNE